MPLTKLIAFTKKVADLADKPNTTMTAAQVKAQFDAAPDELRQSFNALIDALNATTVGDSGAKNIGVESITGLTGNNVHALLVALKSQIDATILGQITDGSLTDIKLSNNPTEIKQQFAAHKAETAKKTTANLTYYVSTTGNDLNDGLTSGTAFKTLGKAISMLPQIINHAVVINITDGYYAESPIIQGFHGYGSITINGNTLNIDAVTIDKIIVRLSTCILTINYIKPISTTNHSFEIVYCLAVSLNNCKSDSNTISAGAHGVSSWMSTISVNNCVFSNKYSGILANNASVVISANNSGTGNTLGLNSISSTIFKNGTQPGGTTAQSTSNGGVIN